MNLVAGSIYLVTFVGPWEKMEVWVMPQVGVWTEGIRYIAKFTAQYPQTAYSGLDISFQFDW